MKKVTVAVLAAALVLPAAASAQRVDKAEDIQADLRCMLAMYATMRNPQLAQAAGASSLYFAGRIEGREPAFDFTAGLKREAEKMSNSDYAFNAKRCFDEIRIKNDALKAAAASGLQSNKRGVGN